MAAEPNFPASQKFTTEKKCFGYASYCAPSKESVISRYTSEKKSIAEVTAQRHCEHLGFQKYTGLQFQIDSIVQSSGDKSRGDLFLSSSYQFSCLGSYQMPNNVFSSGKGTASSTTGPIQETTRLIYKLQSEATASAVEFAKLSCISKDAAPLSDTIKVSTSKFQNDSYESCRNYRCTEYPETWYFSVNVSGQFKCI